MLNFEERILVWLLWASGCLLLLALPAALLPTDWMATAHRWLGLGEFPASPLVDYLTRSISLLYAIYGALMLLIARDVRRFAPVVFLLAWTGFAFGAAMVAVDLHARLPLYWTLCEGPMAMVLSGLFLWLARSIQRS